MNLESEVVLRQQSLFTGKTLLINAKPDVLPQVLGVECDVWTWNYADFCAFQQLSVKAYFSIHVPAEAEYQHVVIFNPKEKKRLDYVLYHLINEYPRADIYLVGAKKEGIEGAASVLKMYGKASKVDSARHCQFWQLFAQPLTRTLSLNDWLVRYSLECQGQKVTICALAGVFSQQKLDIGTAQLLPFLGQVKRGKLADFGCGAGVIAAYLAIYQPDSDIFAYDVDAFALKSTELTCEENGLHMVKTQAVCGIGEIGVDFDAIISNPPFHQGVKTNYQVSEDLCYWAKQHLATTGEVWIVANRFLNYPILLEQQFGQCEVKLDSQGFKVLYAKNK